eukprot:853067_1
MEENHSDDSGIFSNNDCHPIDNIDVVAEPERFQKNKIQRIQLTAESSSSSDNAYSYSDKQQNDVYNNGSNVEIEFEYNTVLNIAFLFGISVLILILNLVVYRFKNRY